MAKSSWDWNAFRLAVIEAGIRGELTADWRAANPDVEPAHVLLERIAEEKAELIRTKQIRKEKPLAPISAEEALRHPFQLGVGSIGRCCANHFWIQLQEAGVPVFWNQGNSNIRFHSRGIHE